MGEALMFRASGEGGGSYVFVTEIIESSKVYTVPTGIKNNQIYVRIFGGGGGGGKNGSGASTICAGGGGGWMNNGWVNVSQGSTIQVTIGRGGNGCLYNDNGNSGGTTSFGTYLSASGGTGGIINGSNIYGGNGGAGGGASSFRNSHGGIGYQFGGGGAYGLNAYGGNGGMWGGGGAGDTGSAENGINTISSIQESDGINSLAIGYGAAGTGNGGGGGGYGANGGNGNAGGGGGFGSAGYGGEGRNTCAGGGGAYGHGGGYCTNSSNNVFYISPTHGGGGAGITTAGYKNGANGICIIQYYQKI